MDELPEVKAKANRARKAAPTGVAAPAPAVVPTGPAPAASSSSSVEAAASPAVVSDVIPGPAIPPGATSEGPIQMATVVSPSETAGQAADKAEAVFGDVSARFKSAFDKSSKLGEEMVEFAKGNVEAVMASARVAAKAGETMGQEAADYGRKSFESATAAFKSFATVKSPTELFQLQSDFARASFDSAVAEASKLSEVMIKLAGEIAQPLSNRAALAAEKMKTTVG